MTSVRKHPDYSLMEHVEARALLASTFTAPGQVMSFRVLCPVYASAGCGKLRILRVRTLGGGGDPSEPEAIEVVAGYESYERLAL
ncbi:MAG: hypothetical protein NVSMB31_16170 [Vulcanimicrobiaceae bacterium]